jgi:hypothetical protein
MTLLTCKHIAREAVAGHLFYNLQNLANRSTMRSIWPTVLQPVVFGQLFDNCGVTDLIFDRLTIMKWVGTGVELLLHRKANINHRSGIETTVLHEVSQVLHSIHAHHVASPVGNFVLFCFVLLW